MISNLNDWNLIEFNDILTERVDKNKEEIPYPVLSVTQGKGVILQSEKYKKEIASKDKSSYKIVSREDLVFNPNYLNFGAIGFQDIVEKGLVSSIYGVFSIKRLDLIDPIFLRHLLRSKIMIREYNKFANGSSRIVLSGSLHGMHVRLSVSIKDFKQIKWNFPPLPEQQKIAEILSTVDEQLETIEGLIEKTKELKKGLMQRLLTKGIDHTEFKQTELGEIPVGWEVSYFSDFLMDILDFRGRTPKKLGMDWGGGEIRALSANNVKNGYIDFDKECYLGSEHLYDKWMTKGKLEKYDILFTMEAPLGNVALVPDNKKYILSQRVVAFKTTSKINNIYLKYYLMSDKFQYILEVNSTGTTAKGISQKTLKKLLISLPPLAEQQKIASILSSIDERIDTYEQEKEKVAELKKGLMQQLLTGKVRVTV